MHFLHQWSKIKF